MYEVELKVQAELEGVRARLLELDATPQGEYIQEDTYYNAPHRSFPETDEALRVRSVTSTASNSEPGKVGSVSERTQLTYKGPLVDETSKTRREVETGVDNGEAIDEIFTALDFDAAATVTKRRESFSLDGYTITLDDVETVGEYVEIETVATETEIDSARDGAFEILTTLGLDPADSIRKSYLELVLDE